MSIILDFQSAANSAAMGGAYRAVYLAGGGTSSGPFAQVKCWNLLSPLSNFLTHFIFKVELWLIISMEGDKISNK